MKDRDPQMTCRKPTILTARTRAMLARAALALAPALPASAVAQTQIQTQIQAQIQAQTQAQTQTGATAPDCDAYARAYADAHRAGGASDLLIIDEAMAGAVTGGAWRGPPGARRGARTGAALGVLNTLGDTPAGWRALYDMAWRQCRQETSPIAHRPSTLGDPTHRPAPRPVLPREPLRPMPDKIPERPRN